MNKVNLFDLNRPQDLYRIIHEVYAEYVKEPTERNFLFLALGLTHLREWISECSYNDIKEKQNSGTPLSIGEQFFLDIHALPEFRVIQELCNRSKHLITKDSTSTSKMSGLRAGIGKAGDRLDQTYFLIDGRDSREHFAILIQKYNEWFSHAG